VQGVWHEFGVVIPDLDARGGASILAAISGFHLRENVVDGFNTRRRGFARFGRGLGALQRNPAGAGGVGGAAGNVWQMALVCFHDGSGGGLWFLSDLKRGSVALGCGGGDGAGMAMAGDAFAMEKPCPSFYQARGSLG